MLDLSREIDKMKVIMNTLNEISRDIKILIRLIYKISDISYEIYDYWTEKNNSDDRHPTNGSNSNNDEPENDEKIKIRKERIKKFCDDE